jgi:hypothetical protein
LCDPQHLKYVKNDCFVLSEIWGMKAGQAPHCNKAGINEHVEPGEAQEVLREQHKPNQSQWSSQDRLAGQVVFFLGFSEIFKKGLALFT